MIGHKIGRYEILGELGAGGMGVVYRAHDPVLQRDVALKVLAPYLASDPQARDDFLSEARAAAKLTHPNIVTVYEAGVDNGQVFIAMELVEGGDLKGELERSGRLAPERACAILKDVAEALDHAHNQPQPVIHRDIKPANILLTKDGRPKVADFGIAKVQGDVSRTGTGMLKGTLSYMAPELFEGVKPNPKTDQWSLGVVAYELFSGSHPFIQASDAPDGQLTIMMRIAKANPPRLLLANADAKLEPGIDRVIRRALDRDAGNRFRDATTLSDALGSIVRPSNIIHKIPKWAQVLLLGLAVTIVALFGFITSQRPDPDFLAAQDSASNAIAELIRNSSQVTERSFIEDFAANLDTLRHAGDKMYGLGKTRQDQASGLYYKGLGELLRAWHYCAIGDQLHLDIAIESASQCLIEAQRIGLPPDSAASVQTWLRMIRNYSNQDWVTAKPNGPSWENLCRVYEL